MINKKAVSASILILLIASLILGAMALGYFYLRDKDVKEVLKVSSESENIYAKKIQLDYHLEDIFEKSTGLDIEEGDLKNRFIERYKSELNKYKMSNGEFVIEGLEQIEEQLSEGTDVVDNKIILSLEVELKDAGESGSYKYFYKKKFESADNQPVVNNLLFIHTLS